MQVIARRIAMSSALILLSYVILFSYVTSVTYAQPVSDIQRWKIDPSGSKVAFITQGKGGVNAYFNKFRGTATLNPNQMTSLNIQLEVDANSLSAGLKTPFYKGKKGLDVSQYPKLHFSSQRVERISPQQYKLSGIMNMHGVSKPVTWDMRIEPSKANDKHITLHAVTQIDRSQWGMHDFQSMIDQNIKLEVRTKLVVAK